MELPPPPLLYPFPASIYMQRKAFMCYTLRKKMKRKGRAVPFIVVLYIADNGDPTGRIERKYDRF
jgi:hypothetical protein